MKRIGKVLLAGVASLVALVGCGKAMGVGGASPDAASFYSAHGFGPGGDGPMGFHSRHGLIRKLGLTAEQQERLKAIAQAYRTEAQSAGMQSTETPAAGTPHADWMAKRDELKALLLAEALDTAALKAFIEQAADAHAQRIPRLTAMLAEMREVLTEPQREQLATALAERRPSRHFEGMRRHMAARFFADLGLTTEQQAAFDALKAKLEAMREQGAHREAMIAFTRTGDRQALAAALSKRPDLPVDEALAFLASLDRSQRQTLVSKLERFGGHRKGFAHPFKGH